MTLSNMIFFKWFFHQSTQRSIYQLLAQHPTRPLPPSSCMLLWLRSPDLEVLWERVGARQAEARLNHPQRPREGKGGKLKSGNVPFQGSETFIQTWNLNFMK